MLRPAARTCTWDQLSTGVTNPSFVYRVTNTCLWARANGRLYRRNSSGRIDGSGVYTEYQAVIHDTY